MTRQMYPWRWKVLGEYVVKTFPYSDREETALDEECARYRLAKIIEQKPLYSADSFKVAKEDAEDAVRMFDAFRKARGEA